MPDEEASVIVIDGKVGTGSGRAADAVSQLHSTLMTDPCFQANFFFTFIYPSLLSCSLFLAP